MWEVLHYPLTSFKCRDRPKARNTTVLIVARFSLKLNKSFIHLPVECVDSRKVAPPPRTHRLYSSPCGIRVLGGGATFLESTHYTGR